MRLWEFDDDIRPARYPRSSPRRRRETDRDCLRLRLFLSPLFTPYPAPLSPLLLSLSLLNSSISPFFLYPSSLPSRSGIRKAEFIRESAETTTTSEEIRAEGIDSEGVEVTGHTHSTADEF